MAESMATIQNIKVTKTYELSCELKNFPVAFVNALRRVALADIPTVVLRDIKIIENTTQLPYEMLKHRVEMLPVKVDPMDTGRIREGKIELHVLPNKDQKEVKIITTDDFSGRELLMHDRDLDTPILFMKIRPKESLHITARLSVEDKNVSQVCNSTTKWHIDPELAKINKKTFVDGGGDPREFDNFIIQRSFSRDQKGRPNWFDFVIESIGVLSAIDIFKLTVVILRKKLETYMKTALDNIRNENDNTYSILLDQGGHTLGALLQEVIYSDLNVNFVSYDIPHPLQSNMMLRFSTTSKPELILKTANDKVQDYLKIVEDAIQ